jgi:hypothetical protein
MNGVRDAKTIALILALMRCIYDAGERTARTRRNTAVCAAQRGAWATGTYQLRRMPAVDRTIRSERMTAATVRCELPRKHARWQLTAERNIKKTTRHNGGDTSRQPSEQTNTHRKQTNTAANKRTHAEANKHSSHCGSATNSEY